LVKSLTTSTSILGQQFNHKYKYTWSTV